MLKQVGSVWATGWGETGRLGHADLDRVNNFIKSMGPGEVSLSTRNVSPAVTICAGTSAGRGVTRPTFHALPVPLPSPNMLTRTFTPDMRLHQHRLMYPHSKLRITLITPLPIQTPRQLSHTHKLRNHLHNRRRILVNGFSSRWRAGAIGISAGGRHSMVLGLFGSVWASGDNGFGQLGNGRSSLAYAVYTVGFVDVMPSGQWWRHDPDNSRSQTLTAAFATTCAAIPTGSPRSELALITPILTSTRSRTRNCPLNHQHASASAGI